MPPALNNNLRVAGDIHINAVSLQGVNGLTQNITNQVIGINIYESLFTPFMTGTIHIEDTLDLTNLYPLVGQELVHIDIETPSLKLGNINQTFLVYKMSDRIVSGDKTAVYSLHFISPEAYVDINKKISMAFKGNVSNIAERIIGNKNYGLETEKAVFAHPTKRNHHFISNYWSPVACLNYLARQAIGADDSTSYIFFENRDGFNFLPYEELSNGVVYQDFRFDKHTRDLKGRTTDVKNIDRDYQTILDIDYKFNFDQIEKIKKGMFASKFVGFDILNKEYTEKNFLVYNDGNDTKLNDYEPYTMRGVFSNEAMRKNFMFASDSFEDVDGDTTNFETLQRRMSYANKMGSTILDVHVPGRLDYTAGQVMQITLPIRKPLREQDTNDDVIDSRFSGKYVVGEINHIITRERHETKMMLVSNSINKSVDNE